jgi:hypothetical protein
MTPRRPIEVWRGRAGSHRKSSLLLIGRFGLYMTHSCIAMQFIVTIWIRVKDVPINIIVNVDIMRAFHYHQKCS